MKLRVMVTRELEIEMSTDEVDIDAMFEELTMDCARNGQIVNVEKEQLP